jgi:D-sedoheptulose 7-phosphate isomerase
MEHLELLNQKVKEFRTILEDPAAIPQEKISLLVQRTILAFENGSKLAFVGNGGSAAEAMHIAAEFTGHCMIDHKPLPVLCLNESQSAITAIANDYGVDFIFSRLVEAHLNKNDILVCLSTSGKSPNIIRAMDVAKERGVEVFLWTGENCDLQDTGIWKVPSKITPRIQEFHLLWGHLFAEILENEITRKI